MKETGPITPHEVKATIPLNDESQTAKDVCDILDETIVTIKKGFTKRAFARDENGSVVPVESAKACRWCVMGAMVHASVLLSSKVAPPEDYSYDVACDLTDMELRSTIQAGREITVGLATWNDEPERTAIQVIDALQKTRDRVAMKGVAGGWQPKLEETLTSSKFVASVQKD